eukprot:101346-Pyramimonas_sp.AAC.1
MSMIARAISDAMLVVIGLEDVGRNATLGGLFGVAEADAEVRDLAVADRAPGVLEGGVICDADGPHERHEVAQEVDESAVDR